MTRSPIELSWTAKKYSPHHHISHHIVVRTSNISIKKDNVFQNMFKIFITFKRWLIIVSTSWFAHPTQHLSNTRKGGKPTLLEDFSGLTSFSIMIWSQRWSFNLSMMRSSEQQFRNYWQLFTATSLATAFLTRELSFARPWTGRQVQHRGFVRRGWPHHLHLHHNRHRHHKPQNTLLAPHHHTIQSTS